MWLATAVVLPLVDPPIQKPASIPVTSTVLAVIGLIAGHFEIRPAVQLAAKVIAALLIRLAGNLMAHTLDNLLFFLEIPMKPLALLSTILVAIAIINTLNISPP